MVRLDHIFTRYTSKKLIERVFVMWNNPLQFKVWVKKSRQALNLATNKKFTVSIQSSWNSRNIKYSWDKYFHRVSWRLDKNCGFSIDSQVLGLSIFFYPYFRCVFFTLESKEKASKCNLQTETGVLQSFQRISCELSQQTFGRLPMNSNRHHFQ